MSSRQDEQIPACLDAAGESAAFPAHHGYTVSCQASRTTRVLPLHPRPGLERIIQRNPSYDVRSLLDGVGGVLSSLVQRCLLAGDAAYLLAAFRPLPVPAADRAAATELLAEALRVG